MPARTYPALSYELYPPRGDDAEESLWATIRRLEDTRPDFVSVTYGAAGSNRETALTLLRRLLTETALKPLAHLTCVGSSRAELTDVVERLIGGGVRGILALRGDAPDGVDPSEGDLQHAEDLVRLIRHIEAPRTAQLAAGRVSVGVAAYATRHPDSPSEEHDIDVLLAKQQAGADFAITQVFFQPADYARLLTRARRAGVTIPIIPGVMPLTSTRRVEKLGSLAGIEVDASLLARLEGARSDAERRRTGVAATVELARAALDHGAPGLHLYTFNEHAAALDVLDALGLERPPEAGTVASL
ncbi:5,10-methylenetetrahydrofolate reductase [Arthrobacter agilis]|uniref:methylenetetrahydrofolate reductase n=1 Tax=Arthrobacter agilis TaxID=37921 RepID=UPI000B35DDAD|nr:methylenetetrahydrofolate reductase [Arthrobacter agilis]OUM45025.1 5,10-methylenetetrahydrofolate reductase [Arthrobacter agilis]PPB46910.1 5,10-methylenetetrahydrofolate reductase [Arthrobacter agilis]TPV23497.1 5,10-methylenetetrahydrofolate reductase [Arthrobacter agilis]VDR31893.1 5,10-methylenetetrahydrofolate reductase [Arthrobacter agilis]